jgi:hypothetical protein
MTTKEKEFFIILKDWKLSSIYTWEENSPVSMYQKVINGYFRVLSIDEAYDLEISFGI